MNNSYYISEYLNEGIGLVFKNPSARVIAMAKHPKNTFGSKIFRMLRAISVDVIYMARYEIEKEEYRNLLSQEWTERYEQNIQKGLEDLREERSSLFDELNEREEGLVGLLPKKCGYHTIHKGYHYHVEYEDLEELSDMDKKAFVNGFLLSENGLLKDLTPEDVINSLLDSNLQVLAKPVESSIEKTCTFDGLIHSKEMRLPALEKAEQYFKAVQNEREEDTVVVLDGINYRFHGKTLSTHCSLLAEMSKIKNKKGIEVFANLAQAYAFKVCASVNKVVRKIKSGLKRIPIIKHLFNKESNSSDIELSNVDIRNVKSINIESYSKKDIYNSSPEKRELIKLKKSFLNIISKVKRLL